MNIRKYGLVALLMLCASSLSLVGMHKHDSDLVGTNKPETQLQLFYTALTRATDGLVKAKIEKRIEDLLVRHPHLRTASQSSTSASSLAHSSASEPVEDNASEDDGFDNGDLRESQEMAKRAEEELRARRQLEQERQKELKVARWLMEQLNKSGVPYTFLLINKTQSVEKQLEDLKQRCRKLKREAESNKNGILFEGQYLDMLETRSRAILKPTTDHFDKFVQALNAIDEKYTEANDGPIVFKSEVCITVRAMAKYGFSNEKMNDLYNLFAKLYADNAYMCQMTVNALSCHEHNVGMRAAKRQEKTAQREDSDEALARALSGGTIDTNNADLQAGDRVLEQSLQQQERDFGRGRPVSSQEQADIAAAIAKSLQDQSNSDYDAELEVAKQISAQEAQEREAKEKKEAAADAQAQKPIAPISAQTSLVPSAQAVPAPIASVAQSGVAAPALVPAAPTPNPAPPVITMPTSWWSSNRLALSVGFFTVAALGVIVYCLQGKKGAAKTA